jgi:hypothetical protein
MLFEEPSFSTSQALGKSVQGFGLRSDFVNGKGAFLPDYICPNVVWMNRPRLEHGTLAFYPDCILKVRN